MLMYNGNGMFIYRRTASEYLEFPMITACPLYCFEMGLCHAKVGVASLDQLFVSLIVPNKNGTMSVYQN